MLAAWHCNEVSHEPYRSITNLSKFSVEMCVLRNIEKQPTILFHCSNNRDTGKKVSKVFQCSLSSIGPGADPGVQTVSPQVTISHPPGGRLPTLTARPAVTFPAAELYRPLAGTKLYCLVTKAHRCEQLAQGCYADFGLSIWTHDPLIASPTLYPLRHRRNVNIPSLKFCRRLNLVYCEIGCRLISVQEYCAS